MANTATELIFPTRGAFRIWLCEHAETATGVWLVFGKTKEVVTLTAAEALEEALCFGWIDGQMRRIDETRYLKYFARRRVKSPWSEKNKQLTEQLRTKGIMTPLGEKAIADAQQNGAWNAEQAAPISEEQIAALTDALAGYQPAYDNFIKMSPSVRRTYTGAWLAPKSEEAKRRAFERIVERLNQNLKPM